MSRNDLPSENSSNFNARIRETLMAYLGKVGDPMDRGITLRDLVDSGIVSIANLSLAKKSGSLPLDAGDKTKAGDAPDMTPPPSPTGFAVSAGINTVIIEHSSPLYTQGHGHLRTHVYGVIRSPGDPLPVFANAAEITQFSGTVTSYSTNPSTVWHLWIKWESVDGVLSPSPAGGTNGLVATTGQNVSLLLQALNGQITESQLYASLGQRIDLIDGPVTLQNSMAYLLAEEATARANAISVEASARTTAIDTSVENLQGQIDALAAASGGDLGLLIASIKSEQDIRTSADLAFAGQTTTLVAANSGNLAAIQLEETTRATQDSAQSAQTSLLIAKTGALTAGLLNESNVRSDENAAQASQLFTALTSIGDSKAAANTETQVRATADDANAAQVNQLQSTVGTTVAGLAEERSVSSTANQAVATQVTALTAATGANNAALMVEQTTRTNATEAISGQVTSVAALTANTAASITSEISARATADSSQASLVNLLAINTGTNSAAVASEVVARTNATESIVSTTYGLAALTANTNAGLQTEQLVRAQENSAVSSQVFTVAAGVGSSLASVQNTQNIFVEQDSATAAQIQAVATSTGQSTAAVQLEQTTRTTADSAVSSAINTVQSQWGASVAAIQTEASTRATQTGELYAQYTVKIDTNGYVAGYGLATTAGTSAPQSSFAVRADTFYIANPTGPGVAPAMPFIVRTTPTTINGVAVPVGVYITDAFIQNGTITGGKIAETTIENSKIANGTITGSKLADVTIENSKIVDGTITGSKIANATITNANIIDATITAQKIDSRNLTIKDAAGTTLFSAGVYLNYLNTNASYAPYYNYNFDGTADGFTGSGATVTVNADSTVTVTSTSTNPHFIISGISLNGALYPIIRLKVKRLSGTGVDGAIYYVTGSHGTSDLYKGQMPAIGTDWQIIELDMTNQAVGAPDWINSTITQVRFDFSNASGDSFAVDWVSFGRYSPTAKIDAGNISTYIADAAITNAKIGNVIQSNNYVAGSAGWSINKSGNAEFSSGTFRGSLNGANITGATGTFTGTLSAGTLDLAQLVGTTTRYETPGTYYPVVPAGYTQMRVTLVGGGGGGATNGNGSLLYSGGGGGGGGLTIASYTVTPGATMTVVVGGGGAAGTYNVNGGDGGSSYVSGYASAGGGTGAPFVMFGNGTGGAGGTGTVSGQAGSAGAYEESGPGIAYGGKGGNSGSNYGIGGNGMVGPGYSLAQAGGLYGGGGGGGWYHTNSAWYAAAGASGLAIIEFFNPNGVIVRSEWNTLISALQRQGIATT